MSIGGSLGKVLTKKNLVISTNRKNLFWAKQAKLHLAKNAYSNLVHLKFTKVSLANTIPKYWPTVAVTCDVAGYSDED